MAESAAVLTRLVRPITCALAWPLVLPVSMSLAISAAFIARTAFAVEGVTYFTLFDDAMISMRYARNLAHGHGLVWNSDQAPVEGYSNLLWTLWMAVIYKLMIPEPLISLAIMFSGAALLALNVVVVYRVARRIVPALPGAATLATWCVTFSYPLIFWTLRGMEVGLITLLISTALLIALRLTSTPRPFDLQLLAIVMALGVLTRTDVLLPMVTIAAFTVLLSEPSKRWHLRSVLASTAVGTIAVHTMLRLLYYGDPLPNTYYLKTAGIDAIARGARGLVALEHHVMAYLLLPVVLASVSLFFLRERRSLQWMLVALVVGQCCYSVYVGGDAWEWMPHANRYLTPVMPALFILCGMSVATLQRHWRPGWRRQITWLATIVLVVVVNGEAFALWLIGGAAHARDDAAMVRYGRALAEATAPEATIAVVWAGAIPYVADRPAVDVLGKNDPVVARAGHRWVAQPSYLGGAGFVPGHTRWDYDWSIRQARPDVIAQVFQLTDDDRRAFAAWGYEAVAPGVYVQAGSTRVDRARLATAAATVPRRLLEIDLACDLLASAPTDQRPAMEADAGHCASRGVPPPAPPRP